VRRLSEYDILVDGEAYKVKLIKHVRGAPFSVEVNEKPYEAELVGEIETEAPFSVRFRGKSYEVELKRTDRDNPFPMKVNGVPFRVELKPAARKSIPLTPESTGLAARSKPSTRTFVEGAISAPMAGKIVSVLVKKGDLVKPDDVICVLEAMKMENEIIASKAGTVQEVNVSEGMPVNEGDVLVTIE